MVFKFGAPVTQQNCIYLNVIEWLYQVRHLGNIMHSSLSELPDCELKQSIFNGSVTTYLLPIKIMGPEICVIYKLLCLME